MLIGVVGKANVGKSTFFKAATLAEVEIANYPFATIKPNSGVGYVRVKDAAQDFGKTANPREGFVIQDTRFVPVQLIDVAGLVPGAHEGKGMGNQFLDDLRQADVLVHVVDIAGSTNEKGEPVNPGSYDPAKDIEFLEEELDFWILGLIRKGWEKFSRGAQQVQAEVHKAVASHLSGLGIKEEIVEELIVSTGLKEKNIAEWDYDDLLNLAKKLRQRNKPIILACNKIDIPGAEENFERLTKEYPDHLLIKCSAESELALREAAKQDMISYLPGSNMLDISKPGALSDKQKAGIDFIRKNVLGKHHTTGVQDVLDKAIFDILKYIHIFPGGVGKLEDQEGRVLPDCFLMPQGTTALDFAFKLHTDFGNKFIRAIDVRTKMTVGKEHVLKAGDIVEIIADK